MDKGTAKKLLDKVTADYNKMADEWSRKRWRLPSDIVALKTYAKPKDKILDLGCGNGYLYELFDTDEFSYIGADTSAGQIENCRKAYPRGDFRVTPSLELPFDDNTFDIVYCLSTIHHVPSLEFRHIFLEEIRRVLKPNGLLALTAWDIESHRGDLVTDNFSKSKLDEGDCFVPFRSPEMNLNVPRYIHCFTPENLAQEIAKANFKIIHKGIVERGTGKHKNVLIVANKS